MLLSTLVIEDNNPNLLPAIIVVLGLIFIVYCIISVRLKLRDKNNRKRKDQLDS